MDDLNHFEDRLRDSLQRVEAPGGLARRILARAEARRSSVTRRWLAAAAAILLVAGAGAYGLRDRRLRLEEQRMAQAEQVRQQLLLALEITSRELSKVERQLNAIGVQRIRLEATQ